MYPNFWSCVSFRSVPFPVCPARLAPRWSVSARPVRGVLELATETRNPFFQQTCNFCGKAILTHVFMGLTLMFFSKPSGSRPLRAPRRAAKSYILGYPQVYPQVNTRLPPDSLGESPWNHSIQPDSPPQTRESRRQIRKISGRFTKYTADSTKRGPSIAEPPLSFTESHRPDGHPAQITWHIVWITNQDGPRAFATALQTVAPLQVRQTTPKNNCGGPNLNRHSILCIYSRERAQPSEGCCFVVGCCFSEDLRFALLRATNRTPITAKYTNGSNGNPRTSHR